MVSFKRPLEGVDRWGMCMLTGMPCPTIRSCGGCIIPRLESEKAEREAGA